LNKSVISNWDKLPVVLDLHTVALVFNVSDLTVKQWLYKGLIKGSKIGRKWIFNKDYIKSLTESNNT
jgi:predicted site-specific integrase-resolvase